MSISEIVFGICDVVGRAVISYEPGTGACRCPAGIEAFRVSGIRDRIYTFRVTVIYEFTSENIAPEYMTMSAGWYIDRSYTDEHSGSRESDETASSLRL